MGKLERIKMPGKKGLIVLFAVLMIGAAGVTAVLVMNQQGSVEFTVLDEKKIPQEISSEVIPEYRSLERALACMVDEKVYVIVTRGEKPASGYKVDISKIRLEEEKGKTTMVVYADFCDPDKENSVSQVLTYPLKVAETELKKLPDEVELRVRYHE